MKPGFALSLSFEGISLLQRAAGGWRLVGEVAVDSRDLPGELRSLREKAGALEPGELRCKVIIPNDQVRYISIETGTFDGEARQAMVRRALEGATPYSVDDLAYDTSVDGDTTYVAAIVRDTLVEAEDFAVEHGFNPLCFVASPGDNLFLGEPYFGASAHAASLSGSGKVEPDGIAVVVIGPVNMPEQDQGQESDAEPAPVGFSSRRTNESPDQVRSHSDTPSVDGETDPVVFVSAKARADDAARATAVEQDANAERPVSVIAPTLEIPEAVEPESDEPEDKPSRIGGFLSRRKSSQGTEPAALAAPTPLAAVSPLSAIPPAPPLPGAIADPTGGPLLTAVSRPVDNAFASAAQFEQPQDEAARMTVFGARAQAGTGGKPRHLGLILSAALLIFLAAVAAWATIFLENGVAGLFRSSPPATEFAAVPSRAVPNRSETDVTANDVANDAAPAQTGNQTGNQTGEPTGNLRSPITGATPVSPSVPVDPANEEPTTLALLPQGDIDIPSLPAPRRLAQPDQPDQPAQPELTDTDSAVLDALRQTDPDNGPADQPAVGETLDDPVAQAGADNGATQLLNTAPQVPTTPSIIPLDDLYVASIDRTDLSQDAVALPPSDRLDTDLPPGAVSSPVAAGTEFPLDTAGLVVASAQGTLNPDGILVFLGRPAAVPPAIPARLATQPEIDEGNARQASLARLGQQRPRLRPGNLEERFERNNLGGLSRAELGRMRPRARPDSDQQNADPALAATAQAVAASVSPPARPGNFSAIVSAAVRPAPPPPTPSATGQQAAPAATVATVAPAAPVAPATVVPDIPSSASVARQATLRNEINLRRVNLIGVYGSSSNRRALVRLPSGRYKRVKVGDTVDGGRVLAIGNSELRYQKRGRSLTLKIPSS